MRGLFFDTDVYAKIVPKTESADGILNASLRLAGDHLYTTVARSFMWLCADEIPTPRPPKLCGPDHRHHGAGFVRDEFERIKLIHALIDTLPANEVCVWEDEVDIDLNPRIGFDGMLPGTRRRVMTPGKNVKRYLAGATIKGGYLGAHGRH
jgi:hypothetical protein